MILIAKLMMVWLMLLTSYNLLRLAAPAIGIDQSIFGLIANAINSFFLVLVLFSIVLKSIYSNKVHYLIVFSIALSIYILIVGYAHQNTGVKWKHIYLIFFSCLFVILGMKISSCNYNFNLMPIFKMGFYLNIITTISFFILLKFIFIYPGYGTQTMGYISIFFLVYGKPVYFIISFIMLVSQGKRGVLISSLLCLVIYYATRAKKNIKYKFYLAIIITPFIMILLLFFIDYFNLYEIRGIARLAYINPFSEKFDLYMGSSGRVDEVLSAFNEFNKNGSNYIFGAGSGFSYEWTLSYREEYSEIKGYVHLSPAYLLFIFGPIFTILFYFILFYFLVNALKLSIFIESNQYLFFSISGFFFLISGVFSLNILSDTIGWLFIGLSIGYVLNNKLIKK